MGIVDKVLGGLSDKEQRSALNNENSTRNETGPAALATGKPAQHTVDDRIGGDHTRHVKDAVVHENVSQHADHEVTPLVNRTKEETEIHQKIQPVVDNQEHHTHHQHNAPAVSRNVQENIGEDHAERYRSQGQHHNEQRTGEQTHSTSVNAPIVREHVNKHIVEEVQPIIERQTQRVEHHHTTQAINETHVKAPVVHQTTSNAPITMQEFAGKVEGMAGSALGSHGSSSHGSHNTHGTSGLTGNSHSTTGLTGNNHSNTGLTGNNHSGSGSGLTGNNHSSNNTTSSSSGGGLLSKLTGGNKDHHTGDGVTGSNRTGDNVTGTGSGLTGDRRA